MYDDEYVPPCTQKQIEDFTEPTGFAEPPEKSGPVETLYVPEWRWYRSTFSLIPSFYYEHHFWQIKWLGFGVSRIVVCRWRYIEPES